MDSFTAPTIWKLYLFKYTAKNGAKFKNLEKS